jgi:hypothetical protein
MVHCRHLIADAAALILSRDARDKGNSGHFYIDEQSCHEGLPV